MTNTAWKDAKLYKYRDITMRLRNLNEIFLLHRPKAQRLANSPLQPAQFGIDSRIRSPHLHLETCLRDIWIVFEQNSSELYSFAAKENIEIHRGADAFALTLKIACGLRSGILGETEIFGQFKKAWASISVSHPLTQEFLGKWMMALFEDTKAIRTQFLQGKGGSSYGTLLRRLLKLHGQEKILVLGAGQLSESILPYFEKHPIRVWNRSDSRLAQLQNNLHRNITLTAFSEIEFTQVLDLSWPDQVIICIPGLTIEVEKLLLHVKPHQKVIHLGAQDLNSHPHGHRSLTLQDLFQLRDETQEVRDINVKRAEYACFDRAIKRLPKACEQWSQKPLRLLSK